MHEAEREIEGQPDFETGKARHSALRYTVAWPDLAAGETARGLVVFIPGFGGHVCYVGVSEAARNKGVGARLFESMFKTFTADAAFAVVHISTQDLAATPRLDQVLETSPGASLYRPGSSAGANPTTQGISLRSIAPSAASRALVTLDGVPQNDPFGGWVIWSSLPAEAIGDIRMVRGSGAGPYGAGALTGVGHHSFESA